MDTVPKAPPHPMAGMDAFAPDQVAELVRARGVAKARAGLLATFVLGVLAGAFIALGAALSLTVGSDSTLGFGPTRWLAGIAFSLGLILVVVAGAELFTGNNLIVMATASGQVTLARLLRNWGIVYVGNLVGALSVVAMVRVADWWQGGDDAIGITAVTTAAQKAALPFGTAFTRAVLANALVCLAIWLATAGHTVVDKVVAIVPPIAAFVAMGFEHSVANMFLIPVGMTLKGDVPVPGLDTSALDLAGFLHNLAATTLGNVVGGAVLVGVVYWFVYLRPAGHDRGPLP